MGTQTKFGVPSCSVKVSKLADEAVHFLQARKYICNMLCVSYRNILLEKYVSNKMFLIERIFY